MIGEPRDSHNVGTTFTANWKQSDLERRRSCGTNHFPNVKCPSVNGHWAHTTNSLSAPQWLAACMRQLNVLSVILVFKRDVLVRCTLEVSSLVAHSVGTYKNQKTAIITEQLRLTKLSFTLA